MRDNQEMSYVDSKRIKIYNDLLTMVKYYDFYGIPMCPCDNELLDEKDAIKATVSFGIYDMVYDEGKLIPALCVNDIRKIFKVKLSFDIDFNDLRIKNDDGTEDIVNTITSIKIFYVEKNHDVRLLRLFDIFHFNMILRKYVKDDKTTVDYTLICDSYHPVLYKEKSEVL